MKKRITTFKIYYMLAIFIFMTEGLLEVFNSWQKAYLYILCFYSMENVRREFGILIKAEL